MIKINELNIFTLKFYTLKANTCLNVKGKEKNYFYKASKNKLNEYLNRI